MRGRFCPCDLQTLRFEFDPIVDAVVEQRPGEQDESVIEQGPKRDAPEPERKHLAADEVVVKLEKDAVGFAPDSSAGERNCDDEKGGSKRRHPVRSRNPIEETKRQGQKKAD